MGLEKLFVCFEKIRKYFEKTKKQILMSCFAYLLRDMEENETFNLFNSTDFVTEAAAKVRARKIVCCAHYLL